MEETIYDALRRIMHMVADGKPKAVIELDALAQRVARDNHDDQLRQYALSLAINRGTTADEVVADARKFEEYLRA